MTIRDVYETRFTDHSNVLIKQETNTHYNTPFGREKCYINIYSGKYINIPNELFNIEVEILKPLVNSGTQYNMVVFCKM